MIKKFDLSRCRMSVEEKFDLKLNEVIGQVNILTDSVATLLKERREGK